MSCREVKPDPSELVKDKVGGKVGISKDGKVQNSERKIMR
jgi:hypothetical protein